MKIVLLLAALLALAVLPYLPVFSQPFLSDDYQQVDIGRSWGPVSGWAALAAEPLYRCRATSIVLTHWTEILFGMSPRVFYTSGVLLHALNVWMLFALGFWKRIGYAASFAMAAFFAVYAGHEEAVMWYAAVHELLMFFFTVAFLMLWIRWVNAPRRGWLLYAASSACFLLALGSKESGVVLVPLAALLAWWDGGTRKWRKVAGAVPFAVVALFYAWAIFAAGNTHQHLNDGTFSFHAPFWITWRNSFGRLLWIWGLLGGIWFAASGEWRRYGDLLLAAGVWISVTLLPFSFLTYMPRIPSRHAYLPSAGLALLAGAAFVSLRQRAAGRYRWLAPAVAMLVIAHNCLYVWLVKGPRYLERARPTENLLALVRAGRTPVRIHCFPVYHEIPELAVAMMLHRDPHDVLIWDEGYRRSGCPNAELSYPVRPPAPGPVRPPAPGEPR
ncbi:MAG: hypothetical protein ABUS51_04255 [Acidobacteriota bacterium]